MRKTINLILFAVLIAGTPMLTSAETPPGRTPSVSAGDLPKIAHDWPSYTGPDGAYSDQSKAP